MNQFQGRIAQVTLFSSLIFAMMAANADIAGTWRGLINAGDRSVSVTLTLAQESAQGRNAGTLEYGEPWTCSLNTDYNGSGQNADSKIFTLSVPLIGAMPGPHCKDLIDGFLELTTGADGALDIVASTKKKKIKDKATLQRQQ